MTKTLSMMAMFGILLLAGCGGDSTSPNFSSPIITQPKPSDNELSEFFKIPLNKSEWNNGIFVGGTVMNRALGNGLRRTYYYPSESNATMQLTEEFYKQDNTPEEFFQRVEAYRKQNEYKDQFTWQELSKDQETIFVKATYSESETVKYDEYMKFLLKNKKLYTLSLLFNEKLQDNPEIVKWIKILQDANVTTIKYIPTHLPRCTIEGNQVIGLEGKTCSDNAENELTCNQGRPTLNHTFTAGAGKSIDMNGVEYRCQ